MSERGSGQRKDVEKPERGVKAGAVDDLRR